MADHDDHLHEVLDDYAKFLQNMNLALDKHQPYLVRWVREFLLFVRTHAGYGFEQTLDLLLAEAGGRVGTKPWQLQQASDAIRIYRYQYRGAKAKTSDGPVYFGSPLPASKRCCFCARGHDHGTKWQFANPRKSRRNTSPKR